MTDIIVIGGGIMGLTISRELARAGRKTLLLEKGQPGGGTTWASAGIISPHGSSGSADIAGEPGLRLRKSSFKMWPDFYKAICEESGMDPEFRLTGVLLLALGEEDEREIREKAATGEWGDTEWLGPEDLRREEPALAQGLVGALLVDGGNVEVRRLTPALEIACRRAGVEIRTAILTQEILESGGRVRGVRTSEGDFEAPTVVLCAGVGSASIMGARPAPPITPQRGQVAALDAVNIGIRHVLMVPDDPYVVPRVGGRVILGATREFAGEDPRLTAGGLAWLLGTAVEVMPALADAPILETWTGFRPLCTDHLPLIGEGEIGGLFFCTGHGPTGITPAPVSAALTVSLIAGEAPPIDPKPYDPKRFS
jgi:glycine oxidase